MCFSAHVSLVTFILGLAGAALVWSLNTPFDHILGAFTGFVALMQGIEYLLWQNQRCNDAHKWTSVAGLWLNHLQPLVLGGLILFFSPRLEYANWIVGIMAAYTAAIVPYSLQYSDKGATHCTTPRVDDPHLIWRWNIQNYNKYAYSIFLMAIAGISMLGMPTLEQGIVTAVVISGLFLLSMLIYSRETVGALWCFFGAFVPLSYYFFRLAGYEI